MNRSVRMFVVVTCGVLVWFLLVSGLARIQIAEHDRFNTLAEKQHNLRVVIPFMRGRILDRRGTLLAGSISSPSVIANPAQIADAAAVSRVLGPLVGSYGDVLFERLSDRRKKFVWIRRKVDPALWESIEAKNLPGVYRIPEIDRVNPSGPLARQVVGSTDVDGVGLGGIEKQFDRLLRGTPGWQVLQRVPSSESRPVCTYPCRPPVNGCDIVLTLDSDMQSATESELRKAIERCGARWGMALVMDPSTGEILAMASEDGTKGGMEVPRGNRCVVSQFEPGSTFKLITYSAALEEKVVSPDDRFYGWHGKKDFGTYTIRDAKEYDTLTVQRAFELSSNIVTAQVAEALGREKLYAYARDFGFGTLTGIALPGEVPGMLHKPSDWSGRSLETISIGHEVAVNLVQLCSAFSAIANDGVLMEPRIVREIRGSDGEPRETFPPMPVRRVVSVETARTMRRFLEGVVRRGTGKAAAVGNWPTGGKSGTAQMLRADGRFSNTDFISSFIGFVPVGNPKVVAAVILVDPSGISAGGLVAGPAFRNILTRAMCTDLSDSFLPELQREAVRGWLRAKTAEGAAAADAGSHGEHFAQAAAPAARPGRAKMPDLRGLPMRVAKRLLLEAGAAVCCRGGGTVASQSPPAGSDLGRASAPVLTGTMR